MTHFNDSDRYGPYELLATIGQDALTSAFAARRAWGGQLVRLELLHPELAGHDPFRARYLDQAAAMLSLSHPVLPRVLEVLSEAEARGIAFELVPGRSLVELLKRTGRARCPVDLHVYWLRQVLGGIEHAHRASAPGSSRSGFVHGDICPGRVHLGYGGEVQLLGSGLAACRHALSLERGRAIADVRYAAPEVLGGEPASAASDLFSFGVMLWEALARQGRTTDTDYASVSRRRALGNEPDLESVWPDAPDALVELCERALAHDPRDRYASAADMSADLDAYLARAAEPEEALRARLPGWLEATLGPPDEGWARASDPPFSRDVELALKRRRTLSSFPPPAPPPESARPSALPNARDEAATTDDANSAAAGPPYSLRPPSLPPPPLPPPPMQPPSVPPPSVHPPSTPLPVFQGTLSPSPPVLAPEPERRPSDTGGHRAFTSTWISSPAVVGSTWSAARGAALPALAVAVGAVVAVWVVVAQRAPAEHVEAAASSAGALLPAPADAPPVATARAAPARQGAVDATDERTALPIAATPPPAFFGGRVPSGPQRPELSAPLAADELPRVDDARDSLQAAIVRAAKAQRKAQRQRRAKPMTAGEAAPPPAARVAPRDIDPIDPYPAGDVPRGAATGSPARARRSPTPSRALPMDG